jgi:hypothetical protein
MSDKSELGSGYYVFAGLGGKFPPFGQRDLPLLLEPISDIDVALDIGVIVDRGMDRGELLETSHSPESEHSPLSSS